MVAAWSLSHLMKKCLEEELHHAAFLSNNVGQGQTGSDTISPLNKISPDHDPLSPFLSAVGTRHAVSAFVKPVIDDAFVCCLYIIREDKIHSRSLVHLVRSRGAAAKPRNRAHEGTLSFFLLPPICKLACHGRQQKNDCDFRHNRFSAWRRGHDSNLR